MKRLPLLLSFLIIGIISAVANDSIVEKTSKIRVIPIGRVLIDGALYLPTDTSFRNGVSLPEVRLGAVATFGKFDARVEWGYSFGKFSPRDIYITWHINPRSYLRAGYFIPQFGLQSCTGSSHKVDMEEPIPQSVFGNPRLLGVMYLYHNKQWNLSASVFAQNGSMMNPSNTLGRTGVGATGRAVWHPFAEKGKIIAIGFSPQWQSATFNGKPDKPFSTFSSNFPTKTSRVEAVGVTVDSVKSVLKITPELTLVYRRWALESQFYYAHTFRQDKARPWWGSGFFVQARVILNRGGAYEYDGALGCIALPRPKTWEIVAGYNYTNLNAANTGIRGGVANNLNLTLNYQINKWLTWRLNYSWTKVSDAMPYLADRHVNIFQTRFQAIF